MKRKLAKWDTEMKRIMRYKRKMTRKPTPHEKLFKEALIEVRYDLWKEENINIGMFEPQKVFMLKGQSYITDFSLSRLNLIFEIDGQSHLTRTAYDAKRTRRLNNKNKRVVRFQNQETENRPLIKQKIIKAIKEQVLQFSHNLSKDTPEWTKTIYLSSSKQFKRVSLLPKYASKLPSPLRLPSCRQQL